MFVNFDYKKPLGSSIVKQFKQMPENDIEIFFGGVFSRISATGVKIPVSFNIHEIAASSEVAKLEVIEIFDGNIKMSSLSRGALFSLSTLMLSDENKLIDEGLRRSLTFLKSLATPAIYLNNDFESLVLIKFLFIKDLPFDAQSLSSQRFVRLTGIQNVSRELQYDFLGRYCNYFLKSLIVYYQAQVNKEKFDQNHKFWPHSPLFTFDQVIREFIERYDKYAQVGKEFDDLFITRLTNYLLDLALSLNLSTPLVQRDLGLALASIISTGLFEFNPDFESSFRSRMQLIQDLIIQAIRALQQNLGYFFDGMMNGAALRSFVFTSSYASLFPDFIPSRAEGADVLFKDVILDNQLAFSGEDDDSLTKFVLKYRDIKEQILSLSKLGSLPDKLGPMYSLLLDHRQLGGSINLFRSIDIIGLPSIPDQFQIDKLGKVANCNWVFSHLFSLNLIKSIRQGIRDPLARPVNIASSFALSPPDKLIQGTPHSLADFTCLQRVVYINLALHFPNIFKISKLSFRRKIEFICQIIWNIEDLGKAFDAGSEETTYEEYFEILVDHNNSFEKFSDYQNKIESYSKISTRR